MAWSDAARRAAAEARRANRYRHYQGVMDRLDRWDNKNLSARQEARWEAARQGLIRVSRKLRKSTETRLFDEARANDRRSWSMLRRNRRRK